MFCNHSVEKVWIPLHSVDNPAPYMVTPFVYFSQLPAPLPALLLKSIFFDNITQM